MTTMKLLSLLLLLLPAAAKMSASQPTNCQRSCGDIVVPFPFGVSGDARGCYLDGFDLACDTSESQPKLLSESYHAEFINISLSPAQATATTSKITAKCGSDRIEVRSLEEPMNLTGSPFTFSTEKNKLTATGCKTIGLFVGTSDRMYSTGCVSLCNEDTNFDGVTSCTGVGCCQVEVPPRLQFINATVYTFPDQEQTRPNNCSLAFVVEESEYKFERSDLNNDSFVSRNGGDLVRVVLDWSIGKVGCEKAKNDSSSYACVSANSECFNSRNGLGYLCNCSLGYRGNPYEENGCQDIDECQQPELQRPLTCHGKCVNLPGNYTCICPRGTNGNPYEPKGCVSDTNNTRTVIIASVSVGIGSMLLLAVTVAIWNFFQKRSVQKKKERFYRQNLDLLARQQPSDYSDIALIDRMKIYELEELEKATNYFDKERVVGGGGHGQVYKGILSDQHVVAIKRPKITNQNELSQFINEVFVLSRTNHRNVVKFFGCCLQTEVPLLVFEFVSGGTLSNHLTGGENLLPLSFDDRLRIATEVANALSYLHTAAAIAIFHRDIKAANILLDEKKTAKLADFGASRTIGFEQTSIFTVVQGTYGYLDPEYHQTGKLTEKSDVYSFGVILVELLCGRTATPYRTNDEVRTIVMDLLDAIKDYSLYKILDPLVLKEGKKETTERVARLATNCLRLNGKERPTMREVETELEALRSRKLPRSGVGVGGDGEEEEDADKTRAFMRGNPGKQVVFNDGSGLFTNSLGSTTASFETGSLSTLGQYFSGEEMERRQGRAFR